MKTEYYVVLSIYGREAVKRGYEFQNGYCYRGIYDHGKRIAQLEVVVDEPGQYNGYELAWVDVMVEPKNIQKTLKQLSRIGFAGCYASITDWLEQFEDYDEFEMESFEIQKEYNCFIKI